MGTAILRSQDCLRHRFHPETLISPALKPRRNPNPNPNSVRPRRSKRSPAGSQDQKNLRDRDRTMVVKLPAKGLVMGQVTILKRGEELKPAKNRAIGVAAVAGGGRRVRKTSDEDLVLCSTDRLGPEPEVVKNQIRVSEGLYAGSAFFSSSPPPSSLPFPSLFAAKKNGSSRTDAATSDLRRLLRLDML